MGAMVIEGKTRESHAGAEVLTLREEELQRPGSYLGAPLASGSRTRGGKGGSGVAQLWVVIKIIQDRDEMLRVF